MKLGRLVSTTLGAMLVLSLMLAWGGTATLASAKAGGILNDYFGEDPGTFDVQADTTLAVYGLAREIFNTLVRYKGATLELEPELLAKMPEISKDGLVYSFELKKGVKFHDGKTELTSEDVKFTIERMLGPVGLSKWLFDPIKGAKEFMNGKADSVSGITIVDKYRFKLTLEKPYAPFLANLAVPSASIYSKKLVTEAGDKWAHNPVGTGPFKLKRYVPNTEIILERNPNYFEEGLPYLDGINYRIIGDYTTALMEFEAGNLDVVGVPSEAEERQRLLSTGRYELLKSTPLATYYFVFNMSDPAWKDVRLRKALAMCIDKQAIIDSIWGGDAVVATSFVTPGIPGAFEMGKGPALPYDPEKAKKLVQELKAEGKPVKCEAWQRGGTALADTNIAIQEMAKQVGIELNVVLTERAAFGEARSKGKVPANYGNWWADIPDPDNYLYTYFHPSEMMSTQYRNDKVTKLLEEAKVETDPKVRARKYQEAETIIIRDDCAIVPLLHPLDLLLVQKNVHGVIMHPTGVNSYKHTWKDAPGK